MFKFDSRLEKQHMGSFEYTFYWAHRYTYANATKVSVGSLELSDSRIEYLIYHSNDTARPHQIRYSILELAPLILESTNNITYNVQGIKTMSKENEVATNAWGIEHKEADSSLAETMKSNFLPRLQLVSKMSKYSEMEPGVKTNNFGLIVSDDDYQDCGKTVDAMVLSWRQKALSSKEGLSYYDHKSEEFIEVQERADIEQNSGCMYGPEYLLYIPELDALATFFFGSKSLRYEVKKIHKLYDAGAPVTFFGKKIETKGGDVYYSASVRACASPIAPPEDMERIHKEVKKFNNPTSSSTPVAAESKEAAPATNRAR